MKQLNIWGSEAGTESYLKMNLQFFAQNEGPGGEKTEEATPKKLEDARKEGQVARSQELTMSLALLGLFVGLKLVAGLMGTQFVDLFNSSYRMIDEYSKEVFNSNYATAMLNEGIWNTVKISLPLFAIAVVIAVAANVLQVKWKPTGKPLQPKFSKLSPIKGFKRMFSMDKLMDLLKAILKIGLIAYIAYSTIMDESDTIKILYGIGLNAAIMLIGDIAINLGIKISLVYLVIGFADFLYQKFKFKKDMRMTKQEIKDEFKQSEGDPQIKSQIRQRMREASNRRMMQKLPEADVVITNPTHLACAIKYDKETAEAPVLIAKGADFLAQKIKEEARNYGIPIVENKPLARMLYTNVELDEQIPEELYQMTAEVLAYVYAMNNK